MQKKEYTPPILTVVSFRVERGYAESTGMDMMGLFPILISQNNQSYETELFSPHPTWQEGSDSFWE